MGAGIVTSREMRALEINAEYFGLSNLQLMENAGRSIAFEVLRRFKPMRTHVVVFCGLGGNGGDGFAAARHLLCMGYDVEVIVAGRICEIRHDAALKNLSALRHLLDDTRLREVKDSAEAFDVKADVVVDALLGIGLKGVVREPTLELVKRINSMSAFRIAVDISTGMDSDTGEVLGEAVRADLTVTFHKMKPGLLKAADVVGELVVSDVGLPEAFEELVGPGDVSLVVKPRPLQSHKGDFGRLLVLGGSRIYSGAPVLASLAALRTGVDLVYTMAPEKTAYSIGSMSPSLISVKLKGNRLNSENVGEIRGYLERSTAAVIGPGLGLHQETKDAVLQVIEAVEEMGTPLVLDADGLKAVAEYGRKLQVPTIMTPHPGEYSVLTGEKLPEDLEERKEKVKRTASLFHTVILLKGYPDIVSDGGRVKLNFSGNPGMTVGGTGDVLAGIVGALLAQGADHFEAAAAGSFINGAAGDFAREERGYHIIPTDLLEWIPKVVDNPMSHVKVREDN
jgi:NAD(P)H-hydrate epimerase